MSSLVVRQLLLGRVELPPGHPRSGSDYPVFGYLIIHPGGPLLVDTGVAPGHPIIDEMYRPAAISVEAALAQYGIGSDEVAMVINTHLHFDHIGGNRLFPGKPIAVQRAELAAARTARYTVPEWLDFPGGRWQTIDGEAQVAPGVHVIPTFSHTPGHQSVAVQTEAGLEVILGQALHDPSEFESGNPAEELPGPVSGPEVADLIKSTSPVRVWFSHHPEPWPGRKLKAR